VKAGGLPANITAGLGSVFLALAHQRLLLHGRLAFVLPAAIASGEAWAVSRRLIAHQYHLETVISSHDAERPNFSENTDLSEILFIARKFDGSEKPGNTTYVSLWRSPRTIHEALDFANRIEQMKTVVSIDDVGITTIRNYNGKLAEVVLTPAPKDDENWTGALFAQTELLRTCYRLHLGRLRAPGKNEEVPISICKLGELGELGYDRRDIHDAFEVSVEDWSPYDSFWNHEADKVRTISQTATAHLLPRTAAAKGRKLKSASAVWNKAGRILVVERLWPITHRVLAVGFDKDVLGSTWWAFRTSNLSAGQEKALLLWLNGSLSLMLYFGRRVVTRSAWMQMKKPAWTSMPVLDVRTLSPQQIHELETTYDDVSKQGLEALAQLDVDPVRRRIDEALETVLNLTSLNSVRELLAREPGLTAVDIAPRGGQMELEMGIEPPADDVQHQLL
jgi:hypothetical protein